MNYMARDTLYGLISTSDADGFVVVFPSGVGLTPSGKIATWNAGNCCGGARDKGVDDAGFIKEVIARTEAGLSIDRRRVFAIGMSNGAMMSYRLACEIPGLLRGIMAVAGTDNTTRCTPSRPVAVLHVHARDDDRVLFGGGAGKAFRDEAKVTDFVSVPDSIAKWVALNHAGPAVRRASRSAAGSIMTRPCPFPRRGRGATHGREPH